LNLPDIYNTAFFSGLENIDKKKAFKKIVKKVDKLLERGWDEFKEKLLKLYNKNPVNAYKITKRLTWAALYPLLITGETDCLGNKLKGKYGTDINKIKLDDFPDEYKKIFSNKELFSAFKKLIKVDLEENTYGVIITEDSIIKKSTLTLDEVITRIQPAFPKPLNKLISKENLTNNYETLNSKNLDGYTKLQNRIDELKPIFQFFKEDGIRILTDYYFKAKKEGLNVNDRGQNEVDLKKNYSATISKQIVLNSPEIQNRLTMLPDLEKAIKDLETPIRTHQGKFTPEELKIILKDIEGKPWVKGLTDSIANKLKIKGAKKQTIKNLHIKMNEYHRLEEQLKKAYYEIDQLAEEMGGEQTRQYAEICNYIELGDICRLFKEEEPLSNVDRIWKEISSQVGKSEDTFNLSDKEYETLANNILGLGLGLKKDELIKEEYGVTISKSTEKGKRSKGDIIESETIEWLYKKTKAPYNDKIKTLKEAITEIENLKLKGIEIENTTGLAPETTLKQIINFHNYQKLKDNSIKGIIEEDHYTQLKSKLLDGTKLLSKEKIQQIIGYENMIDYVWYELNNNSYEIKKLPNKELVKKETERINKEIKEINIDNMKGRLVYALDNGMGNASILQKLILIDWKLL